jgi:hypothetical protein
LNDFHLSDFEATDQNALKINGRDQEVIYLDNVGIVGSAKLKKSTFVCWIHMLLDDRTKSSRRLSRK